MLAYPLPGEKADVLESSAPALAAHALDSDSFHLIHVGAALQDGRWRWSDGSEIAADRWQTEAPKEADVPFLNQGGVMCVGLPAWTACPMLQWGP